jgi:DNA-binding transcriptional regulator YiaG
MSFKQLTPEEIEFVRQNLDMPRKELAKKLGISHAGLNNRIGRMGLTQPQKRFTAEQIKIISENLDAPRKELAEKLGITVDSLCNKIRKLRFNRTREQFAEARKKLTPEQMDWIRENSGLPFRKMAEQLGVGPETARSYFMRMGLKRTPEQIKANLKRPKGADSYPYFKDIVDKKGILCRYIFLSSRLRKKYINYLFEQAGKPVPQCAAAYPKDGDYFNFDLENWYVKWNNAKSKTNKPSKVIKAAKPEKQPKPEKAPKITVTVHKPRPITINTKPPKITPKVYATRKIDPASIPKEHARKKQKRTT